MTVMRSVLRVISGAPSAAQDGPQADDAALAAAVARGERQAMAVLTKRCLPVVHALARRLLGDAAEAEDVAQDTFVKIWRSIERYDPGRARLESWAGKIAVNTCYDRLRKRGERLLDDDPPDLADAAPRADAVMATRESAARVRAAIDALPPRQRAALELCALRDHSNVEAADMLDISVEALESLLARARRRLKAQLADDRAELLDGFTAGEGGRT